ncbi:phosphoribosylanthranilate isomerase TRP1 SCDLUD_005126 [Saccharomycodes ludwigii]|uniref:phosphoribosylanthranilate isomerase TRP1 n=1 Tax=Saccharomycodes ludwigii TaxID=36035 RepID=UPI001E843E29|nr:hypothetical protein SCDLUD_005126 [Saccharomycodes ludwigii]KAH3898790.1 hypothetical protein SCDLUD_005126 [Saccharomycodes ludwigii]
MTSKNKIIKICGVKSVQDCATAISLNANNIGIICVPNKKRTCDPLTAKEISNLVHQSKDVELVGVFQKQGIEEILDISKDYGLDIIQIHDDNPQWIELVINNIKYGNVTTDDDDDTRKKYKFYKRMCFPRDCDEIIRLTEYFNTTTNNKVFENLLILFDGEQGGTGEQLNWPGIQAFLKKYYDNTNFPENKKFNFILAGGLTPDNVSQAIKTIPLITGVDVSGGVEKSNQVIGSNNTKDLIKLQNFIKNSQQAFF